jgi:hypothetical protein
MTSVERSGDILRRPLRPWSAATQLLLVHLEERGLTHAPRFLGLDDNFEYLTYVDGVVPSPYTWAGTDPELARAAELLRAFHDATVDLRWADLPWNDSYRDHRPSEVVCHNDFGVYNCVFRAGTPVALIDFDTAAPGTRVWDLAFTMFMFVPLHAHADFANASARIRLMCGAYGWDDLDSLLEVLLDRISRGVDHARHVAVVGGSSEPDGDPTVTLCSDHSLSSKSKRTDCATDDRGCTRLHPAAFASGTYFGRTVDPAYLSQNAHRPEGPRGATDGRLCGALHGESRARCFLPRARPKDGSA